MKQQQEQEERAKKREMERAQEIAEAKDKLRFLFFLCVIRVDEGNSYFNSLIESKMSAAEKETMWLAEQKRMEEIEKQRSALSKERGYEKKQSDKKPTQTTDRKEGQVPETHGRVLKYSEVEF